MSAMQSLSDFARDLQIELQGADRPVQRVTTDSRSLQPGDLFVALSGERHDGHDYVLQAMTAGAAGALVSRRQAVDLPQLCVPDTLLGLQAVAAAWRARLSLPVVAVTGSNGKTTTKQLLRSVLAVRGPVLATRGNLNNHIGVPLTLLELRPDHRSAVVEMGANHAGEIARLTELTRPDVGVVTQAGDAHLEGFGSRDGVAQAKGELFAGMRGGIAVINGDDLYAPLWQQLARNSAQLRFGLQDQVDVQALHLQAFASNDVAGTQFVLRTPDARVTVRLPLPGRHNVMNALAAAACAVALGIDATEIAAGLERVEAAEGRLGWKTTREGARLLDDSYNANPSSLRAGMELLAAQPGERWLVLGGMAELGGNAAQLHLEAGRAARQLGIDRLYALGPLAAEAARGFGEHGAAFDEVAALVAALKPLLNPTTTLLVKGSRSARMERVVQALTDTAAGGQH